MFSDCRNISELNQKRIDLIRSGHDSIEVNRAHNKRRVELLNGSIFAYKKVDFIEKPIPKPVYHTGSFGITLGEDDYILYVDYE